MVRQPSDSPGARVYLEFFGTFRAIDAAGTELGPFGRSAIALLAHLALAGPRPVSRDRLATLLWPDRPSEQARHSLRQTLLVTRRLLDGAAGAETIIERDGLHLDHDVIGNDVRNFEIALDVAHEEDRATAIALYRAPLLDGFDARSSLFEDWLVPERMRLHGKAMAAFEQAVAARLAAGDRDAAQALAERALSLEPANESLHRALITLHLEAGQREAALRRFEQCRDALKRLLDAEPQPETLDLRRQAEAMGSDRHAPPTATTTKIAIAPLPLIGSPDVGVPRQEAQQAHPSRDQARRGGSRRRTWIVGGALLAGIAVAAGVVLSQAPWQERPGQAVNMAFPLPDKPSLAVLPFRTDEAGGDLPAIADGITEGINASLLTVSRILVISRTSILSLEQQGVTATTAAERLGVRYLLEGTVRRSGDRLRVTAQLTDAVDGKYVWAERYERQIGDVFTVQDGIVQEIITALQINLSEGEQERHRQRAHLGVEVWLRSGQALQALRNLTRESNLEARRLYEEILKSDPNDSGSYEGLAWTHYLEARFQWSASPADSLAKAATLVEKAIAMDPDWGRAYALLGQIALLNNDLPRALALGEKAIVLGPNDSEAIALLANTMTYAGEIERAETLMHEAMRLSPYYPDWYAWNLGRVLRLKGQPREAMAVLKARLSDAPGSIAPRVELALAQYAAHEVDAAKETATAILRAAPNFSIRAWFATPQHHDPAVPSAEATVLSAIGMPE